MILTIAIFGASCTDDRDPVRQEVVPVTPEQAEWWTAIWVNKVGVSNLSLTEEQWTERAVDVCERQVWQSRTALGAAAARWMTVDGIEQPDLNQMDEGGGALFQVAAEYCPDAIPDDVLRGGPFGVRFDR